jgi:hypothetical protein
MLSDSIVKAVMEADGVDPLELEATLTQIGQSSCGARHTRWSVPWSAETPLG